MLVEITENNGFLIDIKYASKDNFTGEKVYQKPKCFLHQDAFEKLKLSQNFAEKLGYKIKIFDAFRPAEAQYILWNHTPDPNFLAHPERGSAHSRGVAIDLTLVDAKNHKELDMGTEFDAFTPLSYLTENQNISSEAIRNRMVLLGVMSASGWDFYKNEWWHFQLFDAKKYPLIWDKDAKTDMM